MSTGVYRPYLMKDVLRASASRKFIVASMFAGGGGSSIGYCLAGGRVVLANEIEPEAVRTYRGTFRTLWSTRATSARSPPRRPRSRPSWRKPA